jgi:hypothetical protein
MNTNLLEIQVHHIPMQRWQSTFQFLSEREKMEKNVMKRLKFVSDFRQVDGFTPGSLVSFTNKTDCYVITEILLKVALKDGSPLSSSFLKEKKMEKNVMKPESLKNHCSS